MESLQEVLARRGGWSTCGELRGVVSRRALAAAVDRGELRRIALGVYALQELPPDTAAVLAYDGVLSHLSAATAWRLPLLVAPEKPHLTLPIKRRPRPGPPAVLHWADTTEDERRARVTSLLRTVLDCARILPFADSLAVADAALATGRLNKDELLAGAASMRGPRCPNARRAAAAATHQSGSFLESMLRALLITEGIEGFEPQVLVSNGSFRARVDLGHQQARVALEAEGFEFHGSRRDFAADCHRYDELVTAGWLVLRLTYEHIVGDPAWVADTVRSVVDQRLAGVQLDRMSLPRDHSVLRRPAAS